MSTNEEFRTYKYKAGDYLLMVYGNGTQLVYVKELIFPKSKNGKLKLDIVRLYGRTNKLGGHWTPAKPIFVDDGRIIEISKPFLNTPDVNAKF